MYQLVSLTVANPSMGDNSVVGIAVVVMVAVALIAGAALFLTRKKK